MSLFDFHYVINISGRITAILTQNMMMSSILFIIFFGLIHLFKRISPLWQMGLWTIVIIRMVTPPNLNHAYSAVDLISRLCHITRPTIILSSSIPSFLPDMNNWSGGPQQSLSQIGFVSYVEIGLCLLWALGVLFFLGLYCHKWLGIKKILKTSHIVDHKDTLRILEIWKSRFNISRCVKILTSDADVSPFTQGMRNPVIYIPQRIFEMGDPRLLESIIAHEMAHISRFDDFWIKLQIAVQTLFFFHPVIWLVNSRIHLNRECICDSMVLSKKKISAEIYGNGLLTVLKQKVGNNHLKLFPGFGNIRGKWRFRINHLKGEHSMKKHHQIYAIVGLIIIGLFIIPMSSSRAGNHIKTAAIVTQLDGSRSLELSNILDSRSAAISFKKPIEGGMVTARFGNMRDPFTKKIRHHNGIDIKAPNGVPVMAAARGRVCSVGTGKKLGNFIVLQHDDGYTTSYTHLNEYLVSEDQVVNAGDIIGRVGSTGLSTGDHLHFEIRKDDNPIDPEDLIDF